MSVSIELPCGCKVTAVFVLGMCLEHAHELRDKQLEANRAYREFEQKMQSGSTSTASQESK